MRKSIEQSASPLLAVLLVVISYWLPWPFRVATVALLLLTVLRFSA